MCSQKRVSSEVGRSQVSSVSGWPAACLRGEEDCLCAQRMKQKDRASRVDWASRCSASQWSVGAGTKSMGRSTVSSQLSTSRVRSLAVRGEGSSAVHTCSFMRCESPSGSWRFLWSTLADKDSDIPPALVGISI